ncbi:MAG: PH domain-containing protein [Thermoplasmata archaeon]|nr:PH domain-containing protein [Thermoplasmata archaeon]MCI4341031.1 PH domain-containing protein [Thermoplasmata archaeon]
MAGPVVVPGYTPKPKLIKAAYLSPGETVLRESRSTVLYFLPGPVLFLLVFAVLTDAAYVSSGALAIPYLSNAFQMLGNHSSTSLHYVQLLFLFLLLVGLLFLAVRYLKWTRTVYAVTTNRVIVQRGIISRDFDEIPVIKVRAVEVHQSGVDRIFGFGTIRITSEGENRIANEAWRGVPKPWEFQRLVDAAAQKYTNR